MIEECLSRSTIRKLHILGQKRLKKFIFSSWIVIYDGPYSTDTSCIAKNLRRHYASSKDIGWDELLENKCYTDTVFGPVAGAKVLGVLPLLPNFEFSKAGIAPSNAPHYYHVTIYGVII